MPNTIRILVDVKPASAQGCDDDITVTPTQAHACVGDTIVWSLRVPGTLTLDFDESYDPQRKINHPTLHNPKTSAPFEVATVAQGDSPKVLPSAEKNGVYTYAVRGNANGKDFVIPGCPEIIIQ